MQAHLGPDAFVSGLRGVRIWGEAQLRMGQGTIERWTAFAGKSGSRFFLDYFVIKGKGRNPFWGFLPLCYWCVVIVCTI